MVAWKEGAIPETAYGPITAMTFLYNATKDWINILPITYYFRDGGNYPGIESINGITTIEPVLASVAPTILGTEIEPMRARMPIYTSANENKEVSGKTQENEYLYDNLDSAGSGAPYGYWTLSTSGSENAYIVFYDGNVNVGSLATASVPIFSTVVGVRPVITIQL